MDSHIKFASHQAGNACLKASGKSMPSSHLTFVYLDIGNSKSRHLKKTESSINLEIQYSLSTLLCEENSSDYRVVIYTDKVDKYSQYPILVEDIDLLPESLKGWSYIYRAKPCVLLHALQKYHGSCIFLDSDTYLKAGSVNAIRSAVEQGALLARLEGGDTISQGSPACPPCANSGVIGLNSDCGKAVLISALEIIDQTLATGVWKRTLEQAAISESIWRHGLKFSHADPFLVHYSSNSRKRYMHSQIKRLIQKQGEPLPPSRPSIKLTPARVKLYQYYWDVKRTIQLLVS